MSLQRLKIWILNPFVFIAGLESLLLGLVIMFGTTCFGYFTNTHFDGVLDIHIGKVAPFLFYAAEQVIAWGVAVLIFYPAGLILSRSHIRLQDVAGTMALSRWPMIIVSLLGFLYQPGPDPLADLGTTMVAAFVMLTFSIWSIALMYNAFRILCNVKETKVVGGFIVSLLIAEIASKIIFFQLYQHLLTD